ncbi:unnamed protein product, partial [Caretta caretta]
CKEQNLHKPMYLLLCILSFTEISTTTSVLLKALCIFWFNLKGCLTQMFFLYADLMVHSSTLVTMAFDRYVAVSNPLRYTTILTNARIAKIGQPFCANRIIPHMYCDHMSLVKMSCGDITVSRMYGFVAAFVIVGLDLILIALSYALIIRAVIRISSKEAHQKALNTCTAHIELMLGQEPGFGPRLPNSNSILLASVFSMLSSHPWILQPLSHPTLSKTLSLQGVYQHPSLIMDIRTGDRIPAAVAPVPNRK